MLFEAKEYMQENGHLIIVVNKDQGAKTMMKRLESVYDRYIYNIRFFMVLG